MAEIFAKQGHWKEAELYRMKAMTQAIEKDQSSCLYHISRLYTFQEKYAEAETNFLHHINILEKYSSPSHSVYLRTAQNYARLGNETESRRLLEIADRLFEKKTVPPRNKAFYLYKRADTYRILQEYEFAKTDCEQSLTWFLINAEDYQSVAEARLVFGKILVNMEEYQDAIGYLDKAKTAFAIGKHYALGETMLYLGKAHAATGNPTRAQALVADALAEFQRLELSKKEQEAKDMLNRLNNMSEVI
ncbi:MAG: hypothetical protein GY749_40915 [Desulfobacteraceae bacterium]|nr:hypothetical protein [Desulfobacteraceae bacterium]